MENIEALKQFGLSQKQAQVYISLLQIGKGSVAEISQHTELKRPTIYIILEELRKLSLILKVPYSKKALFSAKDPEEFFNERLIKTEQAYSSLRQLKAIHKRDRKISTMYFEGEKGVEEALFYRKEDLVNSEIVGFYAKATALSPRLMRVSHKWRKTMKENNTKVRGLAPKHLSLRNFRTTDKFLNQTFLSLSLKEYSSDVSIDASNLFVRIVLFDVNQAIIIENQSVAKTIREIFEMVWKQQSNK